MNCSFNNRKGYKGQKFEVRFKDEDGKERVFGWQNESSGGLDVAASLHPGWTVIVVPVAEEIQEAYRRNKAL